MAMTTTSFRKTTLSHAQKTVLAMSRAQFLEAIRAAARPADKLYVGVCIFRMDAHSSRPSVLLLRRSGSRHASGLAAECAASVGANDVNTPTTPTGTMDSANSTATGTFPSGSTSRWGRGSRDRSKQNQHQHHHNSVSSDGNGSIRTDSNDDLSERGLRGESRTARTAGMWELPGGKVREGDFCISAAVARRVAEQTGLRVVRVLGALQDVRRVAEVRILDWDDDGVGIFTNNGRGSASNLSVLDGATLTSAAGSPAGSSVSGSTATSGYGYGYGGGVSRRSPIHNPQLVLRKEYLQLNYAVLVQSYDDLSIRTREHDELVWASFSRAEALSMPEELRTVVHQGLAFAGEYLF
ncbi:hypothetical protein GGS26DRAFT_500596 [Hypomontagnella submonticulosa]|nr:hypothetical protein GGS26DRAFT_500596 [Hypomontagnella submonticulosa]